ncbi:MAG: hypothetical protein ACI863_001568 [Flavobacteriales bacterium]
MIYIGKCFQTSVFLQSKKDEIIALNNSIDGLYNVLKTFKDNSIKKLQLFLKPVLLGTLIVTI